MKECPTCQYLLEPGASMCRFCGTDFRVSDAAEADVIAQAQGELYVARPPATPLSLSIVAAGVIGLIIVMAMAGWLSVGGHAQADTVVGVGAHAHVASHHG